MHGWDLSVSSLDPFPVLNHSVSLLTWGWPWHDPCHIEGVPRAHLLLPQERICCWVLMIMEQSTPQSTFWASKSAATLTCCGELWESWLPSPRRPTAESVTQSHGAKGGYGENNIWLWPVPLNCVTSDVECHMPKADMMQPKQWL